MILCIFIFIWCDSHGLNLAGLRQGLVPRLGRVNGSTPPQKELNLDEFAFVNDLWQPQNHFHLDSYLLLKAMAPMAPTCSEGCHQEPACMFGASR